MESYLDILLYLNSINNCTASVDIENVGFIVVHNLFLNGRKINLRVWATVKKYGSAANSIIALICIFIYHPVSAVPDKFFFSHNGQVCQFIRCNTFVYLQTTYFNHSIWYLLKLLDLSFFRSRTNYEPR
jgi:hypothetical protein